MKASGEQARLSRRNSFIVKGGLRETLRCFQREQRTAQTARLELYSSHTSDSLA